ncbi:peptidase M76 family-domain-containing protein [Entophlyctis helioformis]|nr:peptidase M76 family-domain-containing protein [Entophlyctis helioformis]
MHRLRMHRPPCWSQPQLQQLQQLQTTRRPSTSEHSNGAQRFCRAFMLKELDKAGCTLQPDHFKCVPCDPTRAGGFAPTHGIVLCENQLTSKSHMEDTMAHELIHAFDHCTARVKWDKPEHFACSEIRAAALSGDCRFSRELMRGNLGFFKHFQECVRRRAVLGVKQVPTCQADGVAEDAVRAVWDSCFNDTAPFDEIF